MLFNSRLRLGMTCISRCISGMRPKCLMRSLTPSSSMDRTPSKSTSPTLKISRESLVLNFAPCRQSPSRARSSEAKRFKNSCLRPMSLDDAVTITSISSRSDSLMVLRSSEISKSRSLCNLEISSGEVLITST